MAKGDALRDAVGPPQGLRELIRRPFPHQNVLDYLWTRQHLLELPAEQLRERLKAAGFRLSQKDVSCILNVISEG